MNSDWGDRQKGKAVQGSGLGTSGVITEGEGSLGFRVKDFWRNNK